MTVLTRRVTVNTFIRYQNPSQKPLSVHRTPFKYAYLNFFINTTLCTYSKVITVYILHYFRYV